MVCVENWRKHMIVYLSLTIKEATCIEVTGVRDASLTLFSSYMTGWRQGIITLL